MIYSQCFVALSHWGNERVRKWGTEAVKRRAAVKLMQMPRTGAKETAPKWAESLSHTCCLFLCFWPAAQNEILILWHVAAMNACVANRVFPHSFHLIFQRGRIGCHARMARALIGGFWWEWASCFVAWIYICISSFLPSQRDQWNNLGSFGTLSLQQRSQKNFYF